VRPLTWLVREGVTLGPKARTKPHPPS
jgi:hypothetical protein